MVGVRRDGEVFLLELKRGENRLNSAFVAAVNTALDEVERSEGEAALVTTGEGKFYSNGLDIQAMLTLPRPDTLAMLDDVHRLLARLLTFPMITIAAVNGHAFAAGAMLALAHDFRAMRAERGYICLPEVDLRTGRPLSDGMAALLRARLAPRTLHEALVTGRRYPAHEAMDKGLVDEVHPEGELVPRAIEIARGFAGKDRATLAALKRQLYAPALEALARPVPDSLLP